jgi:hypothetical protein
MQLTDVFYNSEELRLMQDALGAAWVNQRTHHDPDKDGLMAAMAEQIMTAVSTGERDPERLRLAALDTAISRSRRYEVF